MTKANVWFKDFPPESQKEELQKIGRELFTTPAGAIFLGAMLDDLCYFRPALTEPEVARRNYATYLLRDVLGLTYDSLAVTTALLNIGQKE